jgi:signal transduction histidine kinase
MNNHKPSYKELEKKLAEAEALLEALRKHEIDAIIGEDNVAVVRLREVEEQLIEAKKTAEQRANDLEAFSYSVSHDLRAPLHIVKAFTQILIMEYSMHLDKTGQKYLDHINNGVNNMSAMINDMLELSKVSRLEIRKEKIDLYVLSATIITEIRLNDPQREVEVIIEKNMTAGADKKLLTLALTNLLKNGWKFTSKTPHPRIEIGVTEQGGTMVFFVRDNGAGFNMTHVKKLFGAFQRLHSEADFPGTGIGLAIVKRVIEKHGGRVWAQSEPGKGATFFFTLP